MPGLSQGLRPRGRSVVSPTLEEKPATLVRRIYTMTREIACPLQPGRHTITGLVVWVDYPECRLQIDSPGLAYEGLIWYCALRIPRRLWGRISAGDVLQISAEIALPDPREAAMAHNAQLLAYQPISVARGSSPK